jgi:hypothetical protein
MTKNNITIAQEKTSETSEAMITNKGTKSLTIGNSDDIFKHSYDEYLTVGEYIDTIEYDYPEFHLSMECFWAEIQCGEPVLLEHEAAKWLSKRALYSVEWLPADESILEVIASRMIDNT